MISQALVQQAGASDDFQEIGSEEKGALKKKFSMDAVLEDKICDLYDLFVEGLDEDSGSQVRKLYVELSQLWPSGLMDNHGIKRAICRAKERRRAVYCRNKDLEKIKSKKMLTPKHEEGVQVESGLVAQPHVQERLATEMAGPVLALASKPVSNSAVASVRLPSPSANGLVVDKLKEKLKGSSSNSMDESKMGVDGALTKKKVKRKPEQESDETHLGSEKLHPQSSGERQHPQSSGERHKSLKHASVLPQKLNPQSTAPSSFEPSS
ncbi:WOUND-RESPONSIVE FAMILY PROTEIN [Salix purpurea]|uniref:WOUND-RESPONSIVE FAMILY PROTEIN n=1 Tax=Salix purpurea TaxID=77065 RepID=A0A9Q0WW62_SALPP|nr:WOUND-RESPONSIVE FAMILY PROTEIN [Salix purpurea]